MPLRGPLLLTEGQPDFDKLRNYSLRVFWDLYYKACKSLHPSVIEPLFKIALDPVNNDSVWQISRRNELNYDTTRAVSLMTEFQKKFNPNTHVLPGILNTQFEVTE